VRSSDFFGERIGASVPFQELSRSKPVSGMVASILINGQPTATGDRPVGRFPARLERFSHTGRCSRPSLLGTETSPALFGSPGNQIISINSTKLSSHAHTHIHAYMDDRFLQDLFQAFAYLSHERGVKGAGTKPSRKLTHETARDRMVKSCKESCTEINFWATSATTTTTTTTFTAARPLPPT
jgi:hypothetical protein